MNYAIKNSLILLGILLIMAGAGLYRIHAYENRQLDTIKVELGERNHTLKQYQQMSNEYEVYQQKYVDLKEELDRYAKLLSRTQDADEVYEFLIDISNDTSFTYFNFTTLDSSIHNEFGILRFKITGEGYYRNLNNFINNLEYGKPLNKISEIKISPINELESLGKVEFSFKLESYYDRKKMFDQYDQRSPVTMPAYTYNAFYPLIHDVRPNESNLPDIEKSRLVSVGKDFITIRSQNGSTDYLYEGDQVYLGRLIEVNFQENKAVFELNKGGIVQKITRVLE